MSYYKNKVKVVAFDFDGVIAKYNGFVAEDHAEAPNTETVEAMRQLQGNGHKILIHSTRGDEFLESYCDKYDIPYDYINRRPDKEGANAGKPIAFVYIDDRAIGYHGQSADDLVKEVEAFKTYWEE